MLIQGKKFPIPPAIREALRQAAKVARDYAESHDGGSSSL